VAFHSTARDLVPGGTRSSSIQVYVRDLATGVTTRDSVSDAGAPANDNALYPSLSDDGRYVGFFSYASNLVPGDTNGRLDAFVRDRATGQMFRVSVSSTGVQSDGDSWPPAISGNGPWAAFASYGSGLAPGDTNGCLDVFVHNLFTHETTRVSVGPGGVQGNGASEDPDFTPDGRYLAFYSAASNLVPGDANGRSDLFLLDRQTGQLRLLTTAASGEQANGNSCWPELTPDARYLAFGSYATNLVPGATAGKTQIYRKDLVTGDVKRVSASEAGVPGNDESQAPSVSANGRFVTFHSDATNLLSECMRITADGRRVVLNSGATNLVPGVAGGVFMADVIPDQNQPPTPPTSIAVTPAAPKTTDALKVVASGSTDSDGDLVRYEYRWAKSADGGTWGEWGHDGDTLDHSLTTKGEQWKARSRAFDGLAYSAWIESAAVTILNTPPHAGLGGGAGLHRRRP
jgi:Tol biopolymer transport system component